MSYPDPHCFAQGLDDLSASVQRKVVVTATANAHLRGRALIRKIENTLTAEEAYWAGPWFRPLAAM